MVPEPLAVLRFTDRKDFNHHVEVPLTPKYDFKSVFDWIHAQTGGEWTATITGEKNSQSAGTMVVSFEQKEAAALFKLFNS